MEHLEADPILLELGLKDKSQEELLAELFAQGTEWSVHDQALLREAYLLAESLHANDQHREQPYIYHLLRNASRAQQYLGVNDPEILAAILLHDAVEDQPAGLIALAGETAAEPNTQRALDSLVLLTTPRVAALVSAVTNEPSSPDLSYEGKLQRYAAKVESAIEDPDVWIVKFVDWIDNAVGIVHSELLGPDRLRHFKRKYAPIQTALEHRYTQPDLQARFSPQAKQYIEHQFTLGRERLALEQTVINFHLGAVEVEPFRTEIIYGISEGYQRFKALMDEHADWLLRASCARETDTMTAAIILREVR